MKRRLVTVAAAASLVLCVATAALWVRSYGRGFGVVRATFDSQRRERIDWLVARGQRVV